MKATLTKPAVLHVGLNLVTGPWSVMRELAKAQTSSGLYAGVGFALITFRDWPNEYQAELATSGLQSYRALTPRVFGTASSLLQRIVKPPLLEWGLDFCRKVNSEYLVLHFHNAWISGIFQPIRSHKNITIRSVATYHGINADFKGQPIRHLIHRWMARQHLRFGVQLTSVDSENPKVAECLFGIPSSNFIVIPNGAPEVNPIVTFQLKQANCLTVGHVGGINRAKGWVIAAEGVRTARSTGRDIRLIVAGAGPDEKEASQWHRKHPEWFDFIGFVHDPQKSVFPRLDGFVLMAEREGLPMAIIEAMSVGLPVIATSVGGIPDAVLPHQTGLLIPRTALSLAEALCDIYDHPERRVFMSRQALSVFRERFEIKRIVSKYHSVYCGEHS